MTASESNGIGKRLLNSMWAFWFVLLGLSVGLATVVYFLWLKGNV
jgi:hypothetical protein